MLDAYAGRMSSTAFFALFRDLCQSSQHLADVRASLSTRRYSWEWLVSTGAGLPTQRSRQFSYLWFLFVVQGGVSELLSLGWGHRVEEGLHPSQFGFGRRVLLVFSLSRGFFIRGFLVCGLSLLPRTYFLNLVRSVIVIDLRKACILPIFILIGFWLGSCRQSLA